MEPKLKLLNSLHYFPEINNLIDPKEYDRDKSAKKVINFEEFKINKAKLQAIQIKRVTGTAAREYINKHIHFIFQNAIYLVNNPISELKDDHIGDIYNCITSISNKAMR